MLFTKTFIAKNAVQAVVAGLVQTGVSNLIVDNTEKTKDDLIVKIPSAVVGGVAANHLSKYTDAMVDWTITAYQNFKNRNKDETPEEDIS